MACVSHSGMKFWAFINDGLYLKWTVWILHKMTIMYERFEFFKNDIHVSQITKDSRVL